MKKSYNKTELQEKAKGFFKDYPNAKEVFATTDGQFFFQENRAALHAGTDVKVFKIENENVQADSDNSIKPASAEALIADAKTIETIDLLEAAKDVEAKGKNRTTVIAAYDARIEELTKDN